MEDESKQKHLPENKSRVNNGSGGSSDKAQKEEKVCTIVLSLDTFGKMACSRLSLFGVGGGGWREG